MRSSTTKTIVIISTIVIVALIAAQLSWLFRIYEYEQKDFRTRVIKSMRGVYEEIELLESSTIRLQKLVEQPDAKTFLMMVHCIPPKDELMNVVIHNLEDFGIFADCNVVVYDKEKKSTLYQAYLPSVGSLITEVSGLDHPQKDFSYIMLSFPDLNRYIVKAMGWWIFSMALILLVLVAFGMSMYYLYRQKFINQIQNDFIRNVTHEFQTPLTTLTLGLDALRKPSISEHPDRKEQYINLMQGQTSYLKYHIDNLMKVLKAESKGLVMEKSEVFPLDLLKNAVAQLEFSVREKNAVITFPKADNVKIMADESSLYVALLNIISNALKYSVEPVIEISCYQKGSHCLISVKDNGIGIEEKNIRHIFKKFYRVSQGDIHDVKGLGLGLYFTKKVIDGHGGTIRVISKRGEGSEFILELPV